MADGESYSTRFVKFWAPDRAAFLWLLCALPPLLFFQTFIHEGLHWLRAVIGGKDPLLIPFPHFNKGFGKDMIGVTLNITGSSGFPQIICFLFLLGVIAVFIAGSPRQRWLREFLTWWYLGLCIDLMAATGKGLFGASAPKADWGKFATEEGAGVALVLAWLIYLTVASQLLWIRYSRWHRNRPPGKSFWDYRVEAIILAVISLFAFYESFAVDDTSIVRNGRFYFFAVGQLVFVLGYVGYLIVAFRKKSVTPAPA